jgi:hypothetical protein
MSNPPKNGGASASEGVGANVRRKEAPNMTRNIKVLGLALMVTFALSAVVASAASAKHHFWAELAPTVGTGEQVAQNIFTTSAGEVKCNTAKFEGTQGTELASELTVTPTYTSCTAFGFATTHVKMNGCDYLFTTPTVDLGGGQFTGAPPHVKCPGVAQIEITPTFPIFGGSVCTVKIPPQTPTSGHVIYKNEGAGITRDVLVTAKVEGIHYTSDSSTCGPTGKTNTDGKYTGSVTLQGFQDTDATKDNVHSATREPVQILTTN